MTPRNPRKLLALTLGLALAGAAARGAQASPISFDTNGTVGVPAGGVPNQVYFIGNPTGSFDPESPGQIDLGRFVVSSLTKQAGTPDVTFAKDPFSILVTSGSHTATVNGVLDGVVGPSSAAHSLTATFTGVSMYNNDPLPFVFKLPTAPVNLSLSDGSTSSATTVMVPAQVPTAAPEPASIAVFGLALGGLGFWHRRRAAR